MFETNPHPASLPSSDSIVCGASETQIPSGNDKQEKRRFYNRRMPATHDPVTHDPRYPVGRFSPPAAITPDDRRDAVLTLAEMPEQLRESLRHLGPEQIDTPYREGGWTVRQLVHHIADSHMAAFFRTRKALTEDWPEITPYDEKSFAQLHDSAAPPEWSLELVESLHARWVMLLQSLTDEQWLRGVRHPESGLLSVEKLALLYAWHSKHHVAHITHLRQQRGG
jgi:hypothetical protein